MMELVNWDDAYLDGIVRLWNQELDASLPMRKTLFEQNSFKDDNVCWECSSIVLDEAGNVIGFIVVKRWQETLDVNMPKQTGWIQALLVDHRYRNKGIGTKLLEHGEKTLKSHDITQIQLGRDPGHYLPGIPVEDKATMDWFRAKGYEHTATDHDMMRAYDLDDAISEPDFSDVTFGVLDESEQDALLAFLHRCFPGRWEYEAMKYFEKGGTGREFVVVRKNGRIIGFSRINDPNSQVIAGNVCWAPLFDGALGGVGPLGVDSAERGHGYGLAVVEAGIAELRKRNVNNIVIDWTGLVDFYKKLGYDIWKSYESYKKTL